MISQPSPLFMPLYSTSQICMRCLTGLTFFMLVALKSIFKKQCSTWPETIFWQSAKSNFAEFSFPPQCQIQKHLVTRGCDSCKKWMCLYSWFKRTYCANHLRCLVGFNECRLKAVHCLEYLSTCAFLAILFTIRNSRDWQPQHHMYFLSSSSLASIRTWDQLNG